MVYFFLFFQQFIASTTHLVAQNVTQSLAPPEVLFFRATGASLIFLPLLWIGEKRWNLVGRIEKGDWGRMFLLGLLNVPINQLLYLEGVKLTTPANSALLYAMTPAMVFIFSWLRSRESHSLLKILGIAIAFVGASVLMFEHGATLRSEHTVGNILIFIAVIAWSLYTMLGRSMVQKYGAVYTTGVNMTIGTVLFLPFGLLSLKSENVAAVTSNGWLELAYLAAISSVANYVMWYWALGKLEATKVAIFQNLQPVMTTIMALILGKAMLTMQLLAGGVMTLLGVLIVQFA